MASFFTELKRRNVFKVGVAYVIVAWIVMQVADVITQNLGLPTWFPQIVTSLLILGLGLADCQVDTGPILGHHLIIGEHGWMGPILVIDCDNDNGLAFL